MREIALDTNVAIDFLNGKKEIVTLLAQCDLIYLPITEDNKVIGFSIFEYL
jgi:predicted nucleic acid-binding protein